MRDMSCLAGLMQPSELSRFAVSAMNTEVPKINLGIGEPWQETPEIIKTAGINAIKNNKTKYTPAIGLKSLRDNISSKLSDEGLDYPADCIVVSSGAKPLLSSSQKILVDKGEGVIIPSPYYPSFVDVAKTLTDDIILVDFICGDFISKLSQAIEKCRMPKLLIINSPNNPTGAVYSRNDLAQIVNLAKKYNLWIISDECYRDFSYESECVSIASYDGIRERTIIIRSFSKSYAMTGWRIGYAAGPKEVMKKITLYINSFIGSPSEISQYAAMSALENKSSIESLQRYFFDNRAIIVNWLNSKNISFVKPRGAFYVFIKYPKINNSKNSSVDFAKYLSDELNIVVTPCIAFGDYDDYIRISYAVNRDKLKEALKRMDDLF